MGRIISTRKASTWIHIVIAVYQFIYIYTPLHNYKWALLAVQYFTFPTLLLTGGWLVWSKRYFKKCN
jgi:hypothetical protein